MYRPQIHFSPPGNWMNDPNGMVYYNGTYHLFYQYYPDSTVWGPMHWGHATTKDLMHWQNLPIALYPDSLGYIFSGSAVADVNNTSGFGKNGKVPLVAMFTSHNAQWEKEGRNDFENQSIAYSLDEGKTWTKYAGNPVLKSPNIRDFRDPKVSWYEAGKKWVLTLATADRITFFSSHNLKDWTKESEFGEKLGGHGGVWECPDLLQFDYNGEKIWITIVNINPGGPNGGSATQYFTGNFDGKTFTPNDTTTKWLDYGPDNYAGVTWSGTGNRKILIGWMSNWNYANVVPTKEWRSANTLPRELGIEKVNGHFYVTAKPVKELNKIISKTVSLVNVNANNYTVAANIKVPFGIEVEADAAETFAFNFSNVAGEKLVAGFDKTSNQFYIDRSHAGKADFNKDFAGKFWSPRINTSAKIKFTIVVDAASIELFADDGLTVMTAVFFPSQPLDKVGVTAENNWMIKTMKVVGYKSVW